MYIDTGFPPGPGRIGQFMRLVADFERDEIEAAVDGFIAMLDARDGDADLEANGDELDGNGSEDDFMLHSCDGPGCPIADTDAGEDDGLYGGAGDPAWVEWHGRGRHKLDRHGAEIVGRDQHHQMLHEDAEDDDPSEDDGEDRCEAGDDQMVAGPVGFWREFWIGSWLRGEAAGSEDDQEPNGDEKDGNGSEDCFMAHAYAGPGCPIADPDLDRGDV